MRDSTRAGIGRFLAEDPDWGAQLSSLIPRPSAYAAMLNNSVGCRHRATTRPPSQTAAPSAAVLTSDDEDCVPLLRRLPPELAAAVRRRR